VLAFGPTALQQLPSLWSLGKHQHHDSRSTNPSKKTDEKRAFT
jgi:hypothetical protein